MSPRDWASTSTTRTGMPESDRRDSESSRRSALARLVGRQATAQHDDVRDVPGGVTAERGIDLVLKLRGPQSELEPVQGIAERADRHAFAGRRYVKTPFQEDAPS